MIEINEAIERIKEHIEIHRLKEPFAIHITEALNMAIDALERLPELEEKAWMYDECNK